MMRWLAFVALLGCGVDERAEFAPDAAVAPDAAGADARTDLPDDGFGQACTLHYYPDKLYTPCTSAEGIAGICDEGVCRRRCEDGCPAGQRPVPILDGQCICEPRQCMDRPIYCFAVEIDG